MRLAILGLAIVAAGAAAFLVQQLTARPPAAPVEQAERLDPQSLQAVLVASTDLGLGQALASSDLKWQEWPEDAITTSFITRDDRPEARSELKSAVTRSLIAAGEPIFQSKLVLDNEGGFMAALLEPGRRAMAVSISEETAVGGFILPNDRVDVILSREGRGEGGSQGIVSETALENVRVLAIDQNYEQVEGKQVFVGETATLEVTPYQAEQLAFAEQSGEIALVLRSVSDVAPGEEVDEQDANRRVNVQLIRYGQPSTVSVKTGK
jgi:pilus assembly protein CpaB